MSWLQNSLDPQIARWIFTPILAVSLSLFANEEMPFDPEALVGWGCSKNEPVPAPTPIIPPEPPPPPPVRHCSERVWKGWGDFLYWQPIQENMEPAGLYTSFILIGFEGSDTGTIVNMDFDYKPAFAAGMGFMFDRKFELSAEYTRFYSTQKLSRSGNPYYPMQLEPSILISFLNGISNAGGGFGSASPTSFQQTWDLDMDLLDVEFGRYQFEHKVVKVRSFVGVRGAWISQDLKTNYTANIINGGPEVGAAEVHARTKSWGVGIRGGLDMACKLGAGFKFYGNGAGDLLYTQYDWHEQANAMVPGLVNRSSDLTQKRIPTVRFHLDTELGFLWGCSYKVRQTHLGYFDFGVGYGFQAFFDQNMFRHFTTSFEEIALDGANPLLVGALAAPISTLPNGNLYLQGLRVHASFTY